ncbi:UDP-3-O-(3-hydroxymyristoyl)glucosamine N-acyltransferase [Myroides marinus]|uniref:UDP-3-O-(3-hydroxymyristoyl)glucosamine N-acyltransferase n=1 Tax=Myroides marinus TaxID=703342 RepID=UPI00257884DD|nr:UDP-3-O-(3-hydroxymyristoyl)glucosamine N-acyltransferase [Myroides marinus]MDM1346150.1 UDP-3-O-(3-hydroxymyristoyl)glucosamine N-acyltransferase [Myroides marinus]MDM1351137.1 UDP-3-O-(3-hydroxymyristoyl)glucosamine N-acyltransferase [Myroides marinus]MDM1353404.1 UDP-3-O-(3-hydroxymyristoyl)glucosamine N-acyltransferase [Myroides marinus]MDM1358347.1 UDP-3-O-(3-hydroxymyristoyl)glucosamine N-acyltransferase [Myroides marinus]MDM1364030.1 UDP-3-O-(3-hydroxymyristoyl)glucosamine N-acyltran
MRSYSLNELNDVLNGTVIGSTLKQIKAAEQLEKAEDWQISFIGNKKYERLWNNSKASVAIVNKDISILPGDDRAFIKVDNVDLALARLLTLFAPKMPEFIVDIHDNASIASSAVIGEGAKIGAGCVVGENVVIGKNVIMYPNSTVLDDSKIGDHTVLWSGVVVRERSKIGSHCILHPNAVIGADGFGFCPSPEFGLVKIPQIGNVEIGNYVEIGANSCVDRGKFSATIIGDGCKIDNLVQIGHNCVLGKFCVMAGNSGLAGSVTLEDFVVIGGSASIKDHVTIGQGAVVGAGSGVTGDVVAGKTVLGYPAQEAKTTLRQWAALKQLVTNRGVKN